MGEVDRFRQCWRTSPIAPILYCKEGSGAVVPLEIDFLELLGYIVVAFESASTGEHARLPGGQSATSCVAQGAQAWAYQT